MNMRSRHSNQAGYSTVLMSLVVVVVGGVFVNQYNVQNKSMRHMATLSNETADAEMFNRSAIAQFKDRWEDGLIFIDINDSDLKDPKMNLTLAGQATHDPKRTWRINKSNNRFVLFRCPPSFDMDPTAGKLITREGTTDADCRSRSYVARTTITPIEFTDTRRALKIKARTVFPDGLNNTTTVALVSVPGQNLTGECKIEIDGVEASEKQLTLSAGKASTELKFSFSPYLTKKIEVAVNGVDQPLSLADMSTSPLVLPLEFTTAGNYQVQFKATGPGTPCEPTVELGVNQPPSACKWLGEMSPGVRYYEDVDLTVCQIPKKRRNKKYKIFRVPGIRFGIEEGVQMSPSAIGRLSTDYTADRRANQAYCRESDHCRYRKLAADATATLIKDKATTTECLNVPNGAFYQWGRRHFLGMFKVGGGECESRLVLMRSETDGCLPGETKVLMANGSRKRIDSVSRGDLVWDPLNRRAVKVVAHTTGEEKEPYVVLHTTSGTIRMTTLHPVITLNGTKKALDVKTGEEVRLESGIYTPVTKITRDKSAIGSTVWNLMLDRPDDRTPTFVADNFVVGDWVTQQGFAHFDEEDLAKNISSEVEDE